jgi:urease accessory protein
VHPLRLPGRTSSRFQHAIANSMRQLLALLVLLIAAPAWAHTAEGVAGGFISGFLHPIAGWDHVVAMVAVGLWGAFLGRPAVWLLPVVFPMVMAFGGALGVVGVPLPGVEIGIAMSAIVLGAMVASAARPPLWVAALIVAVFAIFHGHAHGTELPQSASPIAYSLGFVMATGCLHAAGIGLSLLTRWRQGQALVRAGGGAIAALGVFFLSQALA